MKKRQSRGIGHMFEELDIFTKSVEFRFNSGKTKFKTKIGAFFAILTVFSAVAYGVKRWIEMMNFVDAQIKTTTNEGFYDKNFQYNGGDDFKVAAALTDSSFRQFDFGDDPDYGEIKFQFMKWTDQELSPPEDIRARACRADLDFGIYSDSGDKAGSQAFYEAHSLTSLVSQPGFRCIDNTLMLSGNWYTSSGQNLIISYEPCNPKLRKTCGSEKEI